MADYTEQEFAELQARRGKAAKNPALPASKRVAKRTQRVESRRDYKAELVQQLGLVGIHVESEFKIFENRKFKADWRVTSTRILIEFEGGLFAKGKQGHSSVAGILRDIEKYNLCALAGWIVIRVTPKHVVSGEALQWIERALPRKRECFTVAEALDW